MHVKQEGTQNSTRALTIILVGMIMVSISIGVIKVPASIALICASFANIFLLIFWGVEWENIVGNIMSISHDLYIPMILLLTIGMVVAAWITNGIIPTIMYYGLKFISPSAFLVIAAMLCATMSLITGLSFF